VARKRTIAAFEIWIADEANVEDVLDRIAGGMTLQKVSAALKQPFTCLQRYFQSTPELKQRMSAARQSWVQVRKDRLVEKVDSLPADRDHVAKLKLESEIIDNQAKAYHREMWGERVQFDKSVTIGVDRALLGSVDELLRLANEKVVGGELVGSGTSPAALPAARPPVESDGQS
jgi:hypothetical protein